MKKDEALALFERIYDTLSCRLHYFAICLLYVHGGGMFGRQAWEIIITNWMNKESRIASEQDWQSFKISHGVLETVEDTNAYTDAVRAQAEILDEREGDER